MGCQKVLLLTWNCFLNTNKWSGSLQFIVSIAGASFMNLSFKTYPESIRTPKISSFEFKFEQKKNFFSKITHRGSTSNKLLRFCQLICLHCTVDWFANRSEMDQWVEFVQQRNRLSSCKLPLLFAASTWLDVVIILEEK